MGAGPGEYEASLGGERDLLRTQPLQDWAAETPPLRIVGVVFHALADVGMLGHADNP